MNRILPVRVPALALRAIVGPGLLALAACSSNADRPVASTQPPPPAAVTAVASAATVAGSNVVWALRGALNVAALICQNRALARDYNTILRRHRAILNDAYAAEQARYQKVHGQAGVALHDKAMTRLYNGFASVPDRRRFCTQAVRVADELMVLPSADVPRIARRALTAMEPGALRLVSSAG